MIIFFAVEDGEVLYGQQKTNQDLTVGQIMNSLLQNSEEELKNKLKKIGKTIRTFRSELNQIPYYYRAEVTMPSTKDKNYYLQFKWYLYD